MPTDGTKAASLKKRRLRYVAVFGQPSAKLICLTVRGRYTVMRPLPSVGYGSWLCKNALAEALTPCDFGDVAVRGHFSFGVRWIFYLEALLMRIPIVLGSSAATMPASPP